MVKVGAVELHVILESEPTAVAVNVDDVAV